MSSEKFSLLRRGANTLSMISPVTNEEKQKLLEALTTKEKVNRRSKQNNSFQDPTKKAKKIITPQDSYSSDYLGDGVSIMSFPKFLADKGIDINKIERGSKTYERL